MQGVISWAYKHFFKSEAEDILHGFSIAFCKKIVQLNFPNQFAHLRFKRALVAKNGFARFPLEAKCRQLAILTPAPFPSHLVYSVIYQNVTNNISEIATYVFPG